MSCDRASWAMATMISVTILIFWYSFRTTKKIMMNGVSFEKRRLSILTVGLKSDATRWDSAVMTGEEPAKVVNRLRRRGVDSIEFTPTFGNEELLYGLQERCIEAIGVPKGN